MNAFNRTKRLFKKSVPKKCFARLLFTSAMLSVSIFTHGQRNLLSNAAKENPEAVRMLKINEWRSARKERLEKAIAALPDSIKHKLITVAETALTYDWPALPASLYMDYKLTGTRVNYERKSGERRRKLSQLVIGEILEKKGRFIPQITNGLWAILEESSWVAPAHIVVQKGGAGLPDPFQEYIDLNAARTAVSIAETWFMLKEPLQRYAPFTANKVVYELHKRIFSPYLAHRDFWWMGFGKGLVNNWNAWVNTNCLHTALLTLAPGDSLRNLTVKILESADNFINRYPEDGGCDEGPSYWNEAGGKLIRMLQLLDEASDRALNFSRQKVLHNMGTYIMKMQATENFMVNFADAHAKSLPHAESVFRFGQYFKDAELNSFAAFVFKKEHSSIPGGDVTDFLATADVYATLQSTSAIAPLPRQSWLPDLQVLTMRSNAGSEKGFFAAIQGGHNNESHNHNDVGNFILFANGKPVLIDAGVGVYNSKTFSSARYEIWNMQSVWHNTPTMNGMMQKEGRQFAARSINLSVKNNTTALKMDIAGAYPNSDREDRWFRTFTLDGDKNIFLLKEEVVLKKTAVPSELNFITVIDPDVSISGSIRFPGTGVVMEYNDRLFHAVKEEKPVEDERISSNWGPVVYRVKLVQKMQASNFTHTIRWKMEKAF
ncbi:MAG: heparinase II/III domain-containing protein [Chitinophagaceae bacterium]